MPHSFEHVLRPNASVRLEVGIDVHATPVLPAVFQVADESVPVQEHHQGLALGKRPGLVDDRQQRLPLGPHVALHVALDAAAVAPLADVPRHRRRLHLPSVAASARRGRLGLRLCRRRFRALGSRHLGIGNWRRRLRISLRRRPGLERRHLGLAGALSFRPLLLDLSKELQRRGGLIFPVVVLDEADPAGALRNVRDNRGTEGLVGDQSLEVRGQGVADEVELRSASHDQLLEHLAIPPQGYELSAAGFSHHTLTVLEVVPELARVDAVIRVDLASHAIAIAVLEEALELMARAPGEGPLAAEAGGLEVALVEVDIVIIVTGVEGHEAFALHVAATEVADVLVRQVARLLLALADPQRALAAHLAPHPAAQVDATLVGPREGALPVV
mmetsp:Transcript_172743/g.553719  ORF Transcript_172743/g.553719 Transcript_172743/m.553719 type:complete len:387 (-) Transcript_172743:1175-2335(-)